MDPVHQPVPNSQPWCELPGSKRHCVQLGENNDMPTDDVPDTMLALALVTTVLRATSEFHRQLKRDIQKIVEQQAQATTVMAERLRSMGYQVLVHTTREADSYAQCLQSLRHTSLAVTGAGGLVREPIIVDPFFRDQFEMAKATPQYMRLIQSLPQVIACTETQLRQLVKILCREMHEVFTRRGICIPPWRSKDSLLSKWKLPAVAFLGRDRVQSLPCSAIQQAALRSAPTASVPSPGRQQLSPCVTCVHAEHTPVTVCHVDSNRVSSSMHREGQPRSCESSA